MPRIKIVNANLQVRLQQDNKIVVINDKYNIHLQLYSFKRHGKYPLRCKIVDRASKKTILVKVFLFDNKPDLSKLKTSILNCVIPKELKEIEKYLVGLAF
jgi:hypothetical protein